MTEQEKMLQGEFYNPDDPELLALRKKAREIRKVFNDELDGDKRADILRNLWHTGKNIYAEPNIKWDYGQNIYVGENFYANYDCTFLDVCEIRIGDNALIGPNVQFLTPLHPLDWHKRVPGPDYAEYGAPITIGNNVWIGGGASILPNVTLGDNVVVGAGSVVTKSFGSNIVIAGNPARIIREL